MSARARNGDAAAEGGAPPPRPAKREFSLEWKLTAAFAGALVVVIVLALAVFDTARRALEASREVAHTQDVLETLDGMEGGLAQVESAVRGFTISGDAGFLGERDDALSNLESLTQKLGGLTAGHSPQLRRWRQLRRQLDDQIALLDRIVLIRQTDGAEAARAFFERASHSSSRDLLATLAEMKKEERGLLARRVGVEELRRAITVGAGFVLATAFALLFTLGYVAARRQMAARRDAERRLRDSNLFLDSIIENIPDMIFVKDAAELRFVRFNRAGEELLGHSRDALIGKSDYDFFPEHQADFFVRKDREVLASGGVLDIPEEQIETKDRGVRLLHTKKLPILSSRGEPLYLLGISSDITERRRAEKEIANLNAQLQARAGQLEAANRELESFSYSVSHDLRAPLRAVVGFARLMTEDHGEGLNAEARRKLAVIQDEAHRMGVLIDELLAFSRLGRKALSVAELDMEELARTAYAALEGQDGSRADFRLGGLPRARGDRVLIGQVWTNLLSNARKFSSKRTGAVIEVGALAGGDEDVYFVRDNGAGFDPRYQDKLFGVFQRLHHSSEFPGTGVGLALVKRIVARHGGRIWAESRPGEGATFYFTLAKEAMHGSV